MDEKQIHQEVKEANKLWKTMQGIIKFNLRCPDSEGYVFLSNQVWGASAPFEFARRYGFTIPIFKIKKAYNGNGQFLDRHEAWWVKNKELELESQ